VSGFVDDAELRGRAIAWVEGQETTPRRQTLAHQVDHPRLGDDEAIAILRTCAAALDGDARILLIERDLGDPAASWLDLQMLVMLGGRERIEDEYAALFRAAGLEAMSTTPIGAGPQRVRSALAAPARRGTSNRRERPRFSIRSPPSCRVVDTPESSRRLRSAR
jgi:hypothetical protein